MIPKPDNSTTKIKSQNKTKDNIAPLFTIAKEMKQIKWPPRDKWINKVYIYIHTHTHTHTVEYYSAIKNNHAIFKIMDGLRGYYTKWNKSGKKDKYHMISLICGI